MIRSFIIAGLTFAIVFFSNCKGAGIITHNEEAVEFVATLWPISNITMIQKAWYQDSIGITQMCTIMTHYLIDSTHYTEIITDGYRLFDLKKKWAYEYASFKDTASILKKYQYTDSTRFLGGWNFGSPRSMSVDSLFFLPDTVINTISYRRCKVLSSFNNTQFESIGLLRCDKKTTHFQIDRGIDKRTGCLLVYTGTYPKRNPQSRIDNEIRFVSTTLPDSVLRVFAAWKKNEKTDPVQ